MLANLMHIMVSVIIKLMGINNVQAFVIYLHCNIGQNKFMCFSMNSGVYQHPDRIPKIKVDTSGSDKRISFLQFLFY